MAILTVLEIPNPRLRHKAQAVPSVTEEIRTLMDDMAETVHALNAVGLAAIQVGVEHRVIVVNAEQKDEGPKCLYKMANPEIIWSSEEKSVRAEGCFSVPEAFADVERPAEVHVTYLDENNQPQKVEAKGLLATCIQHEIDHLDGVLFIDYLSPLKRERIIKKLEKARRLST
ncbi:MAG: peptide deformylase [Alphaproteobacteria bacterium]